MQDLPWSVVVKPIQHKLFVLKPNPSKILAKKEQMQAQIVQDVVVRL